MFFLLGYHGVAPFWNELRFELNHLPALAIARDLEIEHCHDGVSLLCLSGVASRSPSAHHQRRAAGNIAPSLSQ